MTRSTAIPVFCAVLALLLAATAHAQVCTPWAIEGQYAFLRRGYTMVDPALPPQQSVSLGITKINHLGETNGTGTLKLPAMDTTYSTHGAIDLDPDCSYVETAELTVAGHNPMGTAERCVVHDGGKEIRCAGNHEGSSYSTLGKRMATPGNCTTRMLQGTFGLTCQGVMTVDPAVGPLPFASSGTFKVDHNGNYTSTGAGSLTVASFLSQAEGKITVNPDCTISLTQLYNEQSVMSAVGVMVSINETFSRTGDPGAAYACQWRRTYSR